MVELFASRRRAEEFARALEAGLESGQVSDARLQGLLETASRLAAVPLVEPRAEFRDSLRERLLTAAASELSVPAGDAGLQAPATTGTDRPFVPDRTGLRHRRRLVAVATGLVLVGGGTGVAAASEQALPGDMLYPVKRTIEIAQVSLASGASAEGHALLDRAGTRLDEARILGSDADPSAVDVQMITSTLGDFTVDAADGGDRLLEAYASNGDPADLQALRSFAAESHRTLERLAKTLPPQARSAVLVADATVVALDERALHACPECAAGSRLTLLSEETPLPGRDDPSARDGALRPVRDLTKDDEAVRGPGGGDSAGGRADAPERAPTGSGGTDDVSVLPDVGLDGPTQTQQDTGAATGSGGGDQPRAPRLRVPDLLDSPSLPPEPTGGTGTGDLEDVTDPLTDPVEEETSTDPVAPLTDGTGDTLGEVEGSLEDTVDGVGDTLP